MSEQKFGPYPGLIRGWVDGDTALIDIDLGFGEYVNSLKWDGRTNMSCRIFGINAPERYTDAGKAAKAFVLNLAPAGTLCTVYSHGWDAYNRRWDGEVILPGDIDVATALVASGNAALKTY